jgi:hypothetical protein
VRLTFLDNAPESDTRRGSRRVADARSDAGA